jgi:hypothetical protein
MQGETREKWVHLCEQAANEQDPEKLMLLIQQINTLLEQKEQRLKRKSDGQSAA